MSSDLIINGFLKFNSLLNDPAGFLVCTVRIGVRDQNCVPSNGTKEMLQQEHGGMVGRIGAVTDSTFREGALRRNSYFEQRSISGSFRKLSEMLLRLETGRNLACVIGYAHWREQVV